MSVNDINSNFASIKGITERWDKPVTKTEVPAGTKSFGEVFEASMKELQSLEGQAEKQIDGLMTGKPGITTHGAMIAMEKADTAFQLMNSIRTKLIRVYEEVLRTAI